MTDDDRRVIPLPGRSAEAEANAVEPDNVLVEVIVGRAIELIETGAATVEEALTFAANTGYAEGWADREDADDDLPDES